MMVCTSFLVPMPLRWMIMKWIGSRLAPAGSLLIFESRLWHQTGDNGAHEERIEGAPSAFRDGGAGLERFRPVDALRLRHLAHQGKARP